MTELIAVYTREDAISDGVLLRFESFMKDEGGLFGPEFVDIELELIRMEDALFPLGELVITRAAAESLTLFDALSALLRHQLGDWGLVCVEDRLANERALAEGRRIFSMYEEADKKRPGEKVQFYVITEWNRETTTILLPGDY